MDYQKLPLDGVFLITPKVFGDQRGYFMETFKDAEFKANVADIDFVQENESMSVYGVVRGLHFQAGDKSQAKLVRVTSGRVLDVIVDLRRASSTFGCHLTVELSSENRHQLFIPRGFAHGFAVLSDIAQFVYKVDNPYAPEAERTLQFNDSRLGIEWPFAPETMIVSPKDMKGVPFDEFMELF